MDQGSTSPRLSPRQRDRARGFVVTSYFPDSEGLLCPTLPRQCPWHSEPGSCDVRRKSQRSRKTGPRFPLTVAKCHGHDASFTLYPPGYAPYQRAAVLVLTADGAPILRDDDKPRSGLGDFEGSLFQAALDARERRPWARNSDDAPAERWWSTQRRHLELALAITGISGEIDERARQLISTVLGVPLLLIQERSRRQPCGYHDRGTATSKVLAAVQPGRSRALRLLLAGHLAGRWGCPHRCNPTSGFLEKLPFYTGGTPAPT